MWIGYDSERSLGRNQTGGRIAAPVFKDYMQAALGKAPIVDFPIPQGITFVSIDRDTGRAASPDGTASFLEAFKLGSEPHYREPDEAVPPYDDDLERTIGRMRARVDGGGYFDDADLPPRAEASDTEAPDENAPGGRRLEDDVPRGREADRPADVDDTRNDDAYRRNRPRRFDDEDASRANRDRRAPPRMDDYLAPLDDREFDRPTRRRGEAEAGDYRSNAPRSRRRIIEEPLD